MNYTSQTFPAAPAREHEPQREIERRRKLRPSDVLARAACVELLRQQVGPNHLESRESVNERVFANCPATSFYFAKAATSPANSATATWASELVGSAMVDFLATDMRESAFAALSAKALTVSLPPGTGSIKIPARTSPATLAGGWVGEGAAKIVYQGSLSAVNLVPSKLACLCAFSEEMLNFSQIETILRNQLAHDLSAMLDQSLLDTTAATATRPAGLFSGASSVTASAITPKAEAMIADLAALHAAVATGNPDARTVFVMNPVQAARVSLTAPQYDNLIVSGYMTAGSVGAVDASALALLVSLPEFALSRGATMHFEGASPLPIATGPQGSAVLAAPTRSLFQEDLVALRCVLRASWAKRRAGCTALTTSVTW